MSNQTLVDPFARRIDYLRVSVTDRCNFRCVYCMPEQGTPPTPKEEHLTVSEFKRAIQAAAQLGMRKIRFTGGEPLLSKDLPGLVRTASEAGFADISATTNGFLLRNQATELAAAGLHRVNVSLDTLHPERFLALARRGELATVLDGIKAARDAGLLPLKLNCVTMRGLNDDEAPDFARWTLSEAIHVRFIELMPIRWDLDGAETFEEPRGQGLLQLHQARGDMLDSNEMRRRFVPADETRASIERELGPLTPTEVITNGPARSFRLSDGIGSIGFISQITHDFCTRCNRLRLTHDGFLRPCLMSDGELDLKPTMRNSNELEPIKRLFQTVVEGKPERHYLAEGQRVTGRGMSQIGG